MKPDNLMSDQLFDILTRQLEHQHAIIRKNMVNYELHREGVEGHDDAYFKVVTASNKARQIRQQLESIMRKEV